MPNIKNNYTSPLFVSGVIIRPNSVAHVPDETFETWKKNATAQRWLNGGILAVEGKTEKPTEPKQPEGSTENQGGSTEPTREELFKEAAELGLNVPNNISTAKLQQKIADKKAETA